MIKVPKYPRSPQPGNVKIHVHTMFFATFQLTLERPFEAPTPMMAHDFVWVVLAGIPSVVEASKQTALDRSAAVP